MRTKQIIQGLNNSQRIRVILNGVGFVTTVTVYNHKMERESFDVQVNLV